jgi:hypothetical protein
MWGHGSISLSIPYLLLITASSQVVDVDSARQMVVEVKDMMANIGQGLRVALCRLDKLEMELVSAMRILA